MLDNRKNIMIILMLVFKVNLKRSFLFEKNTEKNNINSNRKALLKIRKKSPLLSSIKNKLHCRKLKCISFGYFYLSK